MFFMNVLRKINHGFDKTYNFSLLKWKKCKIGKNVRVNGRLKVYGNKGGLSIGDGVIINSNIDYNPIGGWSGCSFFCRDNGSITICEGAGISNSAFCSASSIVIEKQVYIGGGCRIYDTDFHSIDFKQRMQSPDVHIKSKPVVIKHGAWIGGGSIILKGVVIGEYSVIGAGSVVTRSVPAGEIWAGNPARFIRKLDGIKEG